MPPPLGPRWKMHEREREGERRKSTGKLLRELGGALEIIVCVRA